ncbi:hypothetical protein NDU88_007005 [Pleurodeles waltl]|uniref:Uncharacterized protein n=1 Tax=Pleurodeles waltl TaxID=8319 RepID=A0AAV7PP11_PLEWA|nr:hypothetical protein NDU88_007005 [Pleurodeles waltl]
MAAGQGKKKLTLKDLLTKPLGSQTTERTPPPSVGTRAAPAKADIPVTRSFLEVLFSSLRDDLQTLKKDLSDNLKEVCHNLDGLGDRVSSLEDQETSIDEKIEQLQQDIIHLQNQHLELQAQAEDLENRSQQNDIQIKGVPSGAEGTDVTRFVVELFRSILEESTELDIKLDRAHRVDPRRSDTAPPADILVCVHDFQLKECMLRTTRDKHPKQFNGLKPMLYQDLAASMLQKLRGFHPVTTYLRKEGITYLWDHPFRLIFLWQVKIHQICSFKEACQLLGIDDDPLELTQTSQCECRVCRSQQWASDLTQRPWQKNDKQY